MYAVITHLIHFTKDFYLFSPPCFFCALVLHMTSQDFLFICSSFCGRLHHLQMQSAETAPQKPLSKFDVLRINVVKCFRWNLVNGRSVKNMLCLFCFLCFVSDIHTDRWHLQHYITIVIQSTNNSKKTLNISANIILWCEYQNTGHRHRITSHGNRSKLL